jgi:hypothetical protein
MEQHGDQRYAGLRLRDARGTQHHKREQRNDQFAEIIHSPPLVEAHYAKSRQGQQAGQGPHFKSTKSPYRPEAVARLDVDRVAASAISGHLFSIRAIGNESVQKKNLRALCIGETCHRFAQT